MVHLRFAHNGPVAEGETLLAPMLAAGRVVLSSVGPLPYAAVDAIYQDPTEPSPAWDRGLLLGSLEAGTVDALLAVVGPDQQVPLAVVELRHLGGALSRPPAVPNAVAGRDGAYSLFVVGPLLPEVADAVPAAGTSVLQALAPWSIEAALLNIGGPVSPERLATAWSADVHRRLLAVKDTVDPRNVFRFGQPLRG